MSNTDLAIALRSKYLGGRHGFMEFLDHTLYLYAVGGMQPVLIDCIFTCSWMI